MKKPAVVKNERKPIKVTDPNDKRLKAYNDSNQIYNNFIEDVNYVKKKGARFTGIDPVSGGMTYSYPDYGSIILTPKKKPVQPYVYEKPVSSKAKPKTIPKSKPTPKPAPKVESSPKQPQKTVAKEDKKFYQGRAFMDSTGLRPNHYTKSEVNAAVAKKKKK